jgi:hypothetical protein
MYELTAEKPKKEDLIKVKASVNEQRNILLEFEHQICQSKLQCVEAARDAEAEVILTTCTKSLNDLISLKVPKELPAPVRSNLELYLSSMKNGAQKTVDQWEKKVHGKNGGGFLTSITNWEIDSSSYKSIPQSIRRLYGLDKMADVKILTCVELNNLYGANIPKKIGAEVVTPPPPATDLNPSNL